MKNICDQIMISDGLYKSLEKCNVLQQIKNQIDKVYHTNKCHEIKLLISMFQFYDYDVKLTTTLSENPLQLIKLLEKVATFFHTDLNGIKEADAYFNRGFYINIKFTDLPPIDYFLLRNNNNDEDTFRPVFGHKNRLVTFCGLIISLKSGDKFTRVCSLQCFHEFCSFRYYHDNKSNCRNNEICRLMVYYPEFGDHIPVLYRKEKCKCGMVLQENIRERVSEDLIEFSVLLTSNRKRLNRTIFCVSRGKDFENLLRVGRRLYFIGYLIKGLDMMDSHFKIEINNVLIPSPCAPNVEQLSWIKIWKLIPQEISAFDFGPAFVMAFMFADNISVPGSFFVLKLVLMLLLLSNNDNRDNRITKKQQKHRNFIGLINHANYEASCGTPSSSWLTTINHDNYNGMDLDGYRPISLVVAAKDTNLIFRIIRAVCSSTRPHNWHRHNIQDSLLGRVSITDDKNVSVEFGSLLAPESDIVLIDNLLFFSPKEIEQLRKVLDNRLVQLCRNAAGVTIYQQPLQCKVWACIDVDVNTTSSSPNWISNFPNSIGSMINAFDLVCEMDDPPDEELIWDELMAEHLLTSSICDSGIDDVNEYHQLYQSLLLNASQIKIVNWSCGSLSLLRGYYMIGRKSKTGVILPQSALTVLLQFATNLAKLNNRSIIYKTDCLVAIYIYEFLFSGKTGHRIISLDMNSSNKLTHLRCLDECFLKEFNCILKNLQIILEKLIASNFQETFFGEE